MKQPFLILLILLNFGCINRQSSKPSTETETTSSASANIGHPINYDSTEVIKKVYVLNREGLAARQDPDPQAAILATYEYGDPLEVIEQTAEYYGIRDRVTRQFEEQTGTIRSSGWEKIYIPRAQVGPFEQIELCTEELNKVVSSSENINGEMQNTVREKPEPLNGYISIELIDKQLFDAKRSTAVNFLTADTTAIVKSHGEIALPCQYETIRYTDIDSDGDSYRSYTYIGRIDSLNAYVIEGSYYENWGFELIDRADGTSVSIVSYPHLSPDRKYMVCIRENPYEGTADLELYTIRGHKAEALVFASFVNWMPVTTESNETPIFWSADGYLYAAVNHLKAYWKPDGMYNNLHQYIRIKIVAP